MCELCRRIEAIAEKHQRGKLTRAGSRVIATRLPLETVRRITRLAAARGVSPSRYVRACLSRVAGPDAEHVLADLVKALELPSHSGPAEVLDALRDLFDSLSAPADPLQATPDPKPASSLALSAVELSALAKIPASKRAEFLALRKHRAATRAAATNPTRK